jgi:hypothetical protein
METDFLYLDSDACASLQKKIAMDRFLNFQLEGPDLKKRVAIAKQMFSKKEDVI